VSTWGSEACAHMTALATADAPLVWAAVTKALNGRAEPATETIRADLADLDLRPTGELVRLFNREDRAVPDAVAAAADPIANAIDAIVDRLRSGGRLLSVGAGTSGRLAAPSADHEIVLAVGPELVAGSTRLKAGTAQKLVLNAISTISMVRLGKTYGNLMVDVHAANDKLRARARRAVAVATGAGPDAVDRAIAAAQGDAQVALVSLASGIA